MQKTQSADTLQWKILLIVLGVVVIALGILMAVIFRPTPEPQEPQVQVTEPAPTFAPPASNPYGPEDFAEVDGYLTCITGPSSMGIDVSEFQGKIDWEKVKNAGVEFAFLRVGGRGWGTGRLYSDGQAQEYYAGAKAAGLQVGAYFFSQAVSVEEAMEEARYALSLIEGWELDLPMVFDWEYVNSTARTANVKARVLTDCALAFCDVIEDAGLDAMVYFNPSQGRDLMYLEELTIHPFWLAMYNSPMDYPYEVEYWQYTRYGKIPGISGNVDINLRLPKRPIA